MASKKSRKELPVLVALTLVVLPVSGRHDRELGELYCCARLA